MRLRNSLDDYRIALRNASAFDDDGHDAGFANQVAGRIAIQYGAHQTILEPVQLHAWISQPRNLDQRLANPELRAGAQIQQIDAPRRNVLAHVARLDLETACAQLVVKLGLNQVHLAQPPLSFVRRKARRRSPLRPCQPSSADSAGTPAMDLMG